MDGHSNWMVGGSSMDGHEWSCSSNSQSQNLIAHPMPPSMDDHGESTALLDMLPPKF